MRDSDLAERLFPDPTLARIQRAADLIADEPLTEFNSSHALHVLSVVDVLITSWGSPPIDDVALASAPQLKLIAHAAGSVKGHISPLAWDRGIVVTTAADANAIPVADFTLGAILLASKNAFAASSLLSRRRASFTASELSKRTGLPGTTVGIVGASRIGRLVLQRLRAYPVKVLVSDPTADRREIEALGAQLVPLVDLMRESRIVSIHAPLLPSTIGMVGEHELEAMVDGATIINTARGAIIDHAALRRNVEHGRISAVLDVTDPEPLPDGDALYDAPGVFLTPHIAGSLGSEIQRVGEYAASELERFSEGKPALYPVTLDDLSRLA